MNNTYHNTASLSRLHAEWLEPDEPMVIAVDFKGEELYWGDEAFKTEDGLVRDEDVYEFMERKYGKVVTLDED